MEIDLVQQLRKVGMMDAALRKDAADEIDRLRREVKRLNTQVYFYRSFNQKREDGKL
jgi:hypothetical protein